MSVGIMMPSCLQPLVRSLAVPAMISSRLLAPLLMRPPCAALSTTAARCLPSKPKRIAYWPNDWLPFEWEFQEKPMGYFNTGSLQAA